MHANIDRRIVGKKIGLECKTTSVYNDTDFEGGDVASRILYAVSSTTWQ